MGADILAKNTPNALQIFVPICLHKPKSLGFSKRSSLWMSVVRGYMEEMASSEAQANSASTLGEFPGYLKKGWQLFFMFCNYKKNRGFISDHSKT